MKKIMFISLALSVFTFCKKKEKEQPTVTATNAIIQLKDINNQVVPGIVVYAYTQDTWQVLGDSPIHAESEVTSNSEGKAIYPNLEYVNAFNVINNNQNNYRFSAHYSINGINKKKVISITFNKGESKTGIIILD